MTYYYISREPRAHLIRNLTMLNLFTRYTKIFFNLEQKEILFLLYINELEHLLS